MAAGRHVRVGGGVLGADLDAVGLEIEIATNNISFSHKKMTDSGRTHLVVDVEDSLLYLVVDLPRRVDEGLLNVGGGLCRSLERI